MCYKLKVLKIRLNKKHLIIFLIKCKMIVHFLRLSETFMIVFISGIVFFKI